MRAAPAPHTRLRRALPARLSYVVALLATIGQLLVVGAAWLDAAANDGPQAGPHIEQAGVGLHHAHVEDTCLLCAAQHLLGAAPSPASGRPIALRPMPAPAGPLATAPRAELWGAHLSRAPPAES